MFLPEHKWTAETTSYLNNGLRGLAVAVYNATDAASQAMTRSVDLDEAVSNAMKRLRNSGLFFGALGVIKSVTTAPVAIVMKLCGRSLFKSHSYRNVLQSFEMAGSAYDQARVLQDISTAPTSDGFRTFFQSCHDLHLATENFFVEARQAAKRARDQSYSLLIGGGVLIASIAAYVLDIPSFVAYIGAALGSGILFKAIYDRIQDHRAGHLAIEFDPIGKAITSTVRFIQSVRAGMKQD
jgi:hypothetical protein